FEVCEAVERTRVVEEQILDRGIRSRIMLVVLVPPLVFFPGYALQIVPDEAVAVQSDEVVLLLRSHSARELLHSRLILSETIEKLNRRLHLFWRSLSGEREPEQVPELALVQGWTRYLSFVNGLDLDLSAVCHFVTNVAPQHPPE